MFQFRKPIIRKYFKVTTSNVGQSHEEHIYITKPSDRRVNLKRFQKKYVKKYPKSVKICSVNCEDETATYRCHEKKINQEKLLKKQYFFS